VARDRQLGDKLGPRLAQLMTAATVQARQALAPHEARVRTVATQQLIDRAGHELAELYGPMWAEVIRAKGDRLHPVMARHIDRVSSGAHQWESVAGHLAIGATSALSAVLSNVVAPVAYAINAADRGSLPDIQTAIALHAAGLLSEHDADRVAGAYGQLAGWTPLLAQLAQQIPDVATLLEMLRRDLISVPDVRYWLGRNTIPGSLHGKILGLAAQLLSPADAALAVLRGNLDHGAAEAIARANGISGRDFRVLVDNTGEPLGLQQLQEALRRGFISADRFAHGVRQSRVRNEWLDVAEALRYEPMTTADAADAALRGHLTADQAQRIAELNGLRPGDWPAYFANQGNPPAPEQLLELWRRRVIDEDRVRTGIRQGRTRNEWIGDMLHLRYARMTSADALDANLRGHLDRERAEEILQENGLDPRDYDAVFGNAGNPLGLGQLLEAYRRGFIDKARFTRGFRESRYRDEWADVALALRRAPMSTAEAIAALVQGHLDRERAQRIAEENGLDPADFAPLYETAGSPVSATEAFTLYNRGEMTRAQVEQALRESRLKDKYIGQAFQLHVRLPEPRLVITALEHGAIERGKAEQLLAAQGFAHETVAMMITQAELVATGPHKQLMTGEVMRLYSSRVIDEAKARGLLEHLHYSPESVADMLALADYQLQQRILDTGITAIRAHYLAHRIDEKTAAGELHALRLPPSAADTYLRVWKLERLNVTRQLTEAQIVKAYKRELFAPPADRGSAAGAEINRQHALARLERLGYDAGDAGILLESA
jgi:hypothetical protein